MQGITRTLSGLEYVLHVILQLLDITPSARLSPNTHKTMLGFEPRPPAVAKFHW